jgi:hypothetical protein
MARSNSALALSGTLLSFREIDLNASLEEWQGLLRLSGG